MQVFDKIADLSVTSPEQLKRMRVRFGLIYGIAAGLLYGLAAWGVDGLGLAQNHGFTPWLKLGLGLPVSLVLGGLVGWLALKIERAPFSVLLFALAGAVLGWWAGHVPYQGSQAALQVLDPGLAGLTSFQWASGAQARAAVAALAGGVGFGICGLLLAAFVDSSTSATAYFARWFPLIIWLVLMAALGLVSDGLINRPLRDPVVAVNHLVQFAIDNPPGTVPSGRAREIHLAAVEPLRPLFGRPRRLIAGGNDETIQQIRVLIDFDGTWARCTVAYNQPSYCETVTQ